MKKKVLLVCKEQTSISFFNSLEKLSKDFIIDILFFMPHEDEESYHVKLFKNNKFLNNLFLTNSIIKKFFFLKKNNHKPNISNLNSIENNFKDFKNIRMQLNASQKFSTYFHDRNIYDNTNYNDQLIFYEIYYEKISEILNKSKPDYIFDNDISEFRTIIYELSKQKNIPYISIALSYYEDYLIPNFNLQSGPEDWFIRQVKKNENLEKIKLKTPEEFKYDYVEDVLKHFAIRPYVFFREFYYVIKSFFLFFYKKTDYPPPFGAKYFSRNLLNFKILFKKLIIKYFIKFSEYKEEDNEKYIIFPLHVSPEGSTYTISPLFLNETFIIELISNCLPVDHKLLLKEHPAMVGQRSLSFYKKVQKLPNVKFLYPFSKKKIYTLIKNSSAVATISGTSGMEAIILKKPVIVFAKTLYSFLNGCYVFKNVANFKFDLKHILNKNKVNLDSDLIEYVSVVKRYGKKINYTIVNSVNKFPKELINKNIDNFITVFKNGIELIEKKNND